MRHPAELERDLSEEITRRLEAEAAFRACRAEIKRLLAEVERLRAEVLRLSNLISRMGLVQHRAEQAEARLREVLALHREVIGPYPAAEPDYTVCEECGDDWPCATVRAAQPEGE